MSLVRKAKIRVSNGDTICFLKEDNMTVSYIIN